MTQQTTMPRPSQQLADRERIAADYRATLAAWRERGWQDSPGYRQRAELLAAVETEIRLMKGE